MKTLEFNNETVPFCIKDGSYYIAVKPLCKALDVNYNHQYQVITTDTILAAAYRNFDTQVGNQKRKMIYLPEYVLYGWLMQLKSSNEELNEYRKKCFDILHDYFRGSIFGRKKIIEEKANEILKKQKFEADLVNNESFKGWLLSCNRIDKLNNLLRSDDKEKLTESLTLFS